MCIGLTIVVTPPLAVLSACSCWWLGQNAGEQISSHMRLDRNQIHGSSSDQQASNTYSVSSYLAGTAVLVPVYWAQTPLIRVMGGDTGHSSSNISDNHITVQQQQQQGSRHRGYVPPHKATVPFRPPQTVPEMWQRMGRPVVARLMACSVACFCAGVVQAAVAHRM